jgi:hypothetical protein
MKAGTGATLFHFQLADIGSQTDIYRIKNRIKPSLATNEKFIYKY